MGRKHFTEKQIAFALRHHDAGTSVVAPSFEVYVDPAGNQIVFY